MTTSQKQRQASKNFAIVTALLHEFDFKITDWDLNGKNYTIELQYPNGDKFFTSANEIIEDVLAWLESFEYENYKKAMVFLNKNYLA